MAAMYYLFFGLLFIAICSTVGLDRHHVDTQNHPVHQLTDTSRLSKPRYGKKENNMHWHGLAVRAPTKNDQTRSRIIRIASNEIGIREATGNNDGLRVEEYLAYTKLGKGYAWCAAFVSWCYGQAGLPQPRNPWSPALFSMSKTYYTSGQTHRSAPTGETGLSAKINPADVFGIYGLRVRRINHVGLVKATQGSYIITIEGNSNDRVESKRRPISTLYTLADWVSDKRRQ